MSAGPLLAAAVLAAGTTWLLTPAARWLAVRLGAIAQPTPRGVHTRPVPSWGGLAMAAGLAVAALASRQFLVGLPAGLWLGGVAMLAVGVLDDRFDLPPVVKLAGQVAAALLAAWGGVRIYYISSPWGGVLYLGRLVLPATVLWLVAVTNVTNFIDGLDGLAAGVAVIAASTLALVGGGEGQAAVVLLCVAVVGAAVGFLPYNSQPASIFMGDAGSHLLGYALGSLAILGALKSTTALSLVIPVLALALPVADGAVAILRRLWAGRPIYGADQGHVHHQLLARGYSPRQAVLLLYSFNAVCGALALLMAVHTSWAVAAAGAVVLAAVATAISVRVPAAEASVSQLLR